MYLLGVSLPDKKLVSIALQYIHGIGPSTSTKLCRSLLIHPQCRLHELPESKITLLSKELNGLVIESELKRQVANRIQRLVDIKCERGLKHASGRPVNGQHTQTNAKTAKKLNKARFAKAFS